MPSRLIVKPAINFLSTDPDAHLLVPVGRIIRSLTNNENSPDPSPSLAVVAAARDEFRVVAGNAAGGGKLLTLLKNARRAELVGLVRQLASYVAGTCAGDLTKLPLLLELTLSLPFKVLVCKKAV
jgi:hypothetical protein